LIISDCNGARIVKIGQPKAKDIAKKKVARFFRTLITNTFIRLGGGQKFHWYGYTGGLGTGRVYDFWPEVGYEYG